MSKHLNILGGPLVPCCQSPVTGFYRDGYCRTDDADYGRHIICAVMTAEFLAFTQAQGNDLSTPRPGFPGLQPGDRWCLCVDRWVAAYENGVAPPVIPASCDALALDTVPLAVLNAHAVSV